MQTFLLPWASQWAREPGMVMFHRIVVAEVWWGSPAFKAGVTPDMAIISVNGVAYTAEGAHGRNPGCGKE